MNVAAPVLELIALIFIGIHLLGLLFGHRYTWLYFDEYSRINPTRDYAPPVSIVKPNRGLDAWTRENFAGFCEQDYPGPYEIIFCIEDPTDPSAPIIQELIAKYPQRAIQLVCSNTLNSAAKGKLRNLIAGIQASRADVFILSDSDVRVAPDFVRKAVQPLADPKMGLAFAVPAYVGSRDWAAAMLRTSVNAAILHSGSAAFRKRINAAVGAVMVLRRDALNAIGGLEPFSNRIVGIDISISRAIRDKGYALYLLGEPARITHPHSSLSEWWWQIHRWLVTMRSYYPALTPLMLLLGIPLWWAIVFALVFSATGGEIRLGVLPVLLVIIARLVSTIAINGKFARDKGTWRYLWVVPITDLFTLPLMIHSVVSDRVLWGGRWVRVRPDLTADYVQGRR